MFEAVSMFLLTILISMMSGCRAVPRVTPLASDTPPSPEALYEITHGLAACLAPYPDIKKGDVVSYENSSHGFYVLTKDGVYTRSGRMVYELREASQAERAAWFGSRIAKVIPYWCEVFAPSFPATQEKPK
jgi:hypothetical protein